MKKRNGLIKTSLACALIFGGVGLLAGCGNDDGPTISDIYVTGDYADTIKEFILGNDVSLSGATVEVSFSDGTKQTVTVTDEMWSKTDYDFTTIGEKEIIVKFKVNGEEKSETITIKIVNPANVQSVIDAISNLENTSPHDRFIEVTVDSIKNSYNNLDATNKALITNYNDFFTVYKNVKKDVILNYVNISDYEENDRTTVSGYIDTASTSIENATSITEVDNAIQTAKTGIDAVESTLQIRINIVLEAFDAYVEETFNEEDYSPLKWIILQTAIETARTQIENTTNIVFLPNIESGYYNPDFMGIDNKITEDLKADIDELPDVSTVTTYNADLMAKITNILNTYENVLTDVEQDRVSSLILKVEALEEKLATLDLDNYKVMVIASINAFKQKQSEYNEEEWEDILGDINYVINQIEEVVYSNNAKSYIEECYESLMDDLYGYATKDVNDVYDLLSTLPDRTYIVSNKVIFNEYSFHTILDDKFTINSETYTLDGNVIKNKLNDSYEIIEGKVTIKGTVYTVINDLKGLISDIELKYNNLDETEKNNYKARQVNQIISVFKNDIYLRMEYLQSKVDNLKVYKDSNVYNDNNIREIERIIDTFRFTRINAYQLNLYKESVDFYYEIAIESINSIATKLDDIKTSITNLIVFDREAYYQNELEEITAIIDNAVEAGNAVEKGENETILEAVARVQTIIDNAQNLVDEVKTMLEVNTEEASQLVTQLKGFIDVKNYLDLESLDDLDEGLTDQSPEIVKVYKQGVDSIQAQVSNGNKLAAIQNAFENAKFAIEKVGRSYAVELNLVEFNNKIVSLDTYLGEVSLENYYIEIGEVRENVHNYSHQFRLHNNNLESGQMLINGEIIYLEDFKVENGKLYLSIPYLLFRDTSKDFVVSFDDVTTTDKYKINIVGLQDASANVSLSNLSAWNYGEELDEEYREKVGYFPSDKKFVSYKPNAVLSFNYTNDGNPVSGATLVKLDGPLGNVYTFIDLMEYTNINVHPHYDNNYEWAVETLSGNFKVSIYNSLTGLDVNDLEFSYKEEIYVPGFKQEYGNKLEKEILKNAYLPSEQPRLDELRAEFNEKLARANDIEQIKTLWDSVGDVGEVNIQNNTVSIENNLYTLDGERLMWYGVNVGGYITTYSSNSSGSININEITLKIVGEDVYLVSNEDILIGKYSSSTNDIQLYPTLGAQETSYQLRYYISGDGLYKDYGSYIPEEVGTIYIDNETTMITLKPRYFSLSGNYVIDENKVGFTNKLRTIETVSDPLVTIDGVELELTKQEMQGNTYYGGYYEYEIKLGEKDTYLDVSGFDSNDVKVDFSGWGFDYLPYAVEWLQEGRYTINLYASDGQTLLREYDLFITRESAFNSVEFKGTTIETKGEELNKDIVGANKLNVEVKQGYEYIVVVNGEIADNLDNLDLIIGVNEINIEVYNEGSSETEEPIDRMHFFVNYADEIANDIKFDGSTMSGEMITVHNGEAKTLVSVTHTLATIDSIDVLNEYGNSVLNESKIDMTNRPFMKVKVKVVIDGVAYYSGYKHIINMDASECIIGELYIDSWDEENQQNIFGLRNYIDVKYDGYLTLVKGEGTVLFGNQFEYVKVIAPKNYDSTKIDAFVNEEWNREPVTVTLTRCGTTNIYKLIVRNAENEIDTITYFVIEESDHEINDDASVSGGSFTFEDFRDMSHIDSEADALEALQDKIVELTPETITSDDEYYLEGVDEYYSATIKARLGDLFFVMPTNYFVSSYNVTADFLINIDYDSPFYYFFSEFETGDVIIVDVTSPDGTKQVRYIYHIEKTAPDLGAQIIIGEGDEPVVTNEADFIISMGMMTEGMMYGDFFAMDEYATQFIAFVGEQQVEDGQTVTLKLRVSELIRAMGVLTLDGNYDKDDPTSYLNEQDLDGVETTVTLLEVEQDVFIPSVTFFAHQIDEEGNETGIVTYTLLFMENMMM